MAFFDVEILQLHSSIGNGKVQREKSVIIQLLPAFSTSQSSKVGYIFKPVVDDKLTPKYYFI